MPIHQDICAVVPARNESRSLHNVYGQLHRAGIGKCLTVLNGCTDQTLERASVAQALFSKAHHVVFDTPLGPDVPRSIGVYQVLRTFRDVQFILLVDGDWLGSFGPQLEDFVNHAVQNKLDMQYVSYREKGVEDTMVSGGAEEAQQIWNAVISQHAPTLQDIAPSQAPVLIRMSVFQRISPYWLHHPGCWFAQAVKQHQTGRVHIGTYGAWDARVCGNRTRSAEHHQRMKMTLIGDAVEGACLLRGVASTRMFRGVIQDGYHTSRRIDILREWQSSTSRFLAPK